MFSYMQQHYYSLLFPAGFFVGIEYPTTRGATEMLSRSETIRRCAFKLPKNDKYQCQKAGDKYQPNLEIWYCRFHDRHAKDRCKVLVTWAGKGAQCEQLGVLNEKSGEKLCEWHATKINGYGRPQMQEEPSSKRKDVTQGKDVKRVGAEDAEKQDFPRLASPVTTGKQMELAPCLAQTDAKSNHPSNYEHVPPDLKPQGQLLPAGADTVKVGSLNNDKDFCLARLKLEEPATIAAKEDSAPVAAHIVDPHAVDENNIFAAALPLEAVDELVAKKAPGEPCNLGRAPHMRVDSLELSISCKLSEEKSIVITSTPTTHTAYEDVVQSLGSTPLKTAPPRRSLQARIDVLDAQEAQSPTRIAPMYVQCCVCLEKHGEYNMRQVDSCKHRYRDLCLRKAIKTEGLRRFNCSSCRAWMEGQQKRIFNHQHAQDL